VSSQNSDNRDTFISDLGADSSTYANKSSHVLTLDDSNAGMMIDHGGCVVGGFLEICGDFSRRDLLLLSSGLIFWRGARGRESDGWGLDQDAIAALVPFVVLVLLYVSYYSIDKISYLVCIKYIYKRYCSGGGTLKW
jgi:hypothetical protein